MEKSQNMKSDISNKRGCCVCHKLKDSKKFASELNICNKCILEMDFDHIEYLKELFNSLFYLYPNSQIFVKIKKEDFLNMNEKPEIKIFFMEEDYE